MNVEDAKLICKTIEAATQQAFLNRQKGLTLKDLKLSDDLMPSGEKYEAYKKVLEMFQEETVSDALQMIGGMTQEIDSLMFLEMRGRKLDSLKTDFYEEKNK